MILIKRIVGESIDLDTGEEVPRGMLLTNGISELVVPVSDQVMESIILLMSEARGGKAPERAKPATAPIEAPRTFTPTVKPRGTRKPMSQEDIDAHLEAASVSDYMFELGSDGPSVGEIYEDPDTGAGSI